MRCCTVVMINSNGVGAVFGEDSEGAGAESAEESGDTGASPEVLESGPEAGLEVAICDKGAVATASLGEDGVASGKRGGSQFESSSSGTHGFSFSGG